MGEATISKSTERNVRERIRGIVRESAGLGAAGESLTDSTDLYRAGMTSFASVALMVALENEFELEFPDAMLNRSAFESIEAIASAIQSLRPEEN